MCETLQMHRTNLHLCILHMFDDSFLLGAAQMSIYITALIYIPPDKRGIKIPYLT